MSNQTGACCVRRLITTGRDGIAGRQAVQSGSAHGIDDGEVVIPRSARAESIRPWKQDVFDGHNGARLFKCYGMLR